MRNFMVTVDGCIFYKASADNSCDAIIDAHKQNPDARSVSVRVIFDIGTKLVDRLTGDVFHVASNENGWITYKGDAGHGMARADNAAIIFEVE
jgi:hypothetical protein